MIRISRVLTLPFYKETIQEGKSENEFIKMVNTEIKSFVSDGKVNITFRLNADKGDKTRFYFENLSFKRDMKNLLAEVKFRLVIPILIPIFMFFLLGLYTGRGNDVMLAVIVGVLGVCASQIYNCFKDFFLIPKKLILKDRLIYELNFLNFSINNFYFNEVKAIELDECTYFIFKERKKFLEDSLIIFPEIMSEKLKIIEFFQNYANISHNTEFSILDLKSKI